MAEKADWVAAEAKGRLLAEQEGAGGLKVPPVGGAAGAA